MALLLLSCAPKAKAPAKPVDAYGAEALAKTVDIEEVTISPDGSEIAWVSDKSGTLEIWTARNAQVVGGVRQRTQMKETVTGLAWSLYGDLYFQADKGGDERYDLWVLRRGAAAPERVTETPLAEQQVDVSPDGKKLAFVADPDRAFRFNLHVMDLATKQVAKLTSEPINVLWPRWSDDGKTIVATVTPDDQKGELIVVDVESGKERRIAPPRADGILIAVEFLPSGHLLARTTNDEGFEQLARVDVRHGTTELVGPDDWDVEHAAVAPLDGTVVFARNVRGSSEVRSIRAADFGFDDDPVKGAKTLSDEGVVNGIAVSRDGSTAVILRETSNRPPEILVGSTRGRLALAVPADAAGVNLDRLTKARLVTYTSFDGKKIDAFVWTPRVRRLGSPPPAVVKVHGGPGGQIRPEFFAELQALSEAGFVVIGPNYRGSSGYGRAFLDANNKDWGGGDLKDLLAAVDAAAKNGEIDPKRVGIMGGSYGGYMTLRAITATPDRFAAAVDSYGMPDLVEDWELTKDRFESWYETEMGSPKTHAELFRERSPIHFLDKVTAPLLVLQGANDTNVPQKESDLVVEALKKRSHPVEYVIYPDEGHGFTRRQSRIDASTRTVTFFEKHLR